VTTLQAVSGAGYPGVASLDIIDNVIPFISTEEEKMTEETRKMLGRFDGDAFTPAPLVMTAHCNRVPVRDGHTECASVRLGSRPEVEEVTAVLASFQGRPQELGLPSAPKRPIVVRTEENRPQPVLDRDTENGMASRGWAAPPLPASGVQVRRPRPQHDPRRRRREHPQRRAVQGGGAVACLDRLVARRLLVAEREPDRLLSGRKRLADKKG